MIEPTHEPPPHPALSPGGGEGEAQAGSWSQCASKIGGRGSTRSTRLDRRCGCRWSALMPVPGKAFPGVGAGSSNPRVDLWGQKRGVCLDP